MYRELGYSSVVYVTLAISQTVECQLFPYAHRSTHTSLKLVKFSSFIVKCDLRYNELMQQRRRDERRGQVNGALKPNTCQLSTVKDCCVAETVRSAGDKSKSWPRGKQKQMLSVGSDKRKRAGVDLIG